MIDERITGGDVVQSSYGRLKFSSFMKIYDDRKCSTSLPGGNQVDGLPLALSNAPAHRLPWENLVGTF